MFVLGATTAVHPFLSHQADPASSVHKSLSFSPKAFQPQHPSGDTFTVPPLNISHANRVSLTPQPSNDDGHPPHAILPGHAHDMLVVYTSPLSLALASQGANVCPLPLACLHLSSMLPFHNCCPAPPPPSSPPPESLAHNSCSIKKKAKKKAGAKLVCLSLIFPQPLRSHTGLTWPSIFCHLPVFVYSAVCTRTSDLERSHHFTTSPKASMIIGGLCRRLLVWCLPLW